MTTMRALVSAQLVAGILMLPARVSAQQHWDVNGAPAGAGGSTPSGLWSGANWSGDAAGSVATSNYVSSNAVVFSAGTDATGVYAVTNDNGGVARGVGNLTVEEGNVTVSGDGLAVGGRTVRTFLNQTLQIDSALSGAGLTVATNGGRTILTASNALTGTVVISGATGAGATYARVRASNDFALGTASIQFGTGGNNDNSALELVGGITLRNNGAAGTPSRQTEAPNLINVGGTNVFTGTLTSGSGGNFFTVRSDGGKLTLTSNVTTRSLVLNAGAGAIDFAGQMNLSTATNYSFFKRGTGTVTISGIATALTTTALVGQGTLVMQGSNAFANALLTVSNGAALLFNQTGYVFTNSRPVTISGTGPGSFQGALYFNPGTFLSNLVAAPIRLATSATIHAFGVGVEAYFAAPVFGTGSLTFGGRGGDTNTHTAVFHLGTTNDWTGTTTIANNDGVLDVVLRAQVDNALPTNTVLGFSRAGNGKFATLDVNGRSVQVAGITGSSPAGAQYRVVNTSASPGSLVLNLATASSFGGMLGSSSGPLSVIKQGGASFTLTGTNGGTATVVVSNGAVLANGSSPSTVILPDNGILGGAGVAGPVIVSNPAGSLRPGASTSIPSIGALTVSNLVFGHTAGTVTNYFELNNVEYDGNDYIQVNGDVVWTNEVAFDITAYAGSLSEATYILVSYTGTPLASTNGLVVTGPATQSRSAFSLDVTTQPGFILLNVTPGPASNLTWIGSSTNDVWTADAGGPLNWSGNALAFYNFDTVAFTETATVFNVTLSGAVSPGGISVSGSSNYTFGGSGSIAGTGGLEKSGTGTLTLATSNSFSGAVTVSDGLVVLGADSGLGAGSVPAVFTTPAGLDLNGFGVGSRALQVEGWGPDGLGVIVNSGAPVGTGTESIALSGDAGIGGLARWDIRRASLPAGSTQNVDLGGFTLSKEGTNEVSIVNSRVGGGNLEAVEGLLTLSGTTTLAGSGSIAVLPDATLGLYGGVGLAATSWPLSLDGGILAEYGGGANNYGGTITFATGSTNEIRALGSSQLTLGTLAGDGSFVFYGKSNQVALVNNPGLFTGSGTIVTGIWQLAAAPLDLATYTVAGSLASLRMPGNTTYSFNELTINGFGTGSDRLWGALVFDSGSTASPILDSPIVVASDAGIGTYGTFQVLTLNAALSGPGSITFGGRGGNSATQTSVHVLNANSSYEGNTIVQNRDGVLVHTLRIGITDALPVGTTVRLTNENPSSSVRTILDLNGFDQTVAALVAAPNAAARTAVICTGSVATLTITNPVDITFGGSLGLPGGGNFSLVKGGAGTLTVGSSNYFSGTATVNGGRLVLNGPGFGSGAITVASTASLGGTGYVSGAVTVQTGAALAPGNPLAAGTFGISNAVSLAAGASYAWDYAGATNDSVNAVAVTFAGAWTLNASAVGITNGAYVLFRTTAGVTNFVAPTLVGVTGTVTLAGNDVVLTVGDLSTPFQSWQTLNFGSTTNANAAYDQDPDGDGANNLLEYAFGSAPTNGGSVALPQTGTSGNFLTITVPRNSNATDISYVVQGSSNLLDWATNVVLTATNPAPAGSTVTYTNGTANSARPQQFLRVKVTLP